MAIIGKGVLGVVFHGEPAGAVVVVPGKVNVSILGTLPVLGGGVVIF